MTEFQKTGAPSSGGWFVVYRKTRDCEFFASYPKRELDEYGAWLWLIEHAAWKDTNRNDHKGNRVAITRGQLHTSLRALQTAWKWDKSRVERFLNRLREWEMIETQSGKDGRILTICNYDKYQAHPETDENPSEKQTGSSRDTQELNNSGIKELRKEEKEKKPTARKTRLNGDWVLPDEWRDLAKTTKGWSDADVQAEADRFRDYWVNDTSTNALKADWKKTWINWIGRSNRKPNTALRSTMSVKEAQARVNELHSNMSMWNQMGAEARQKGDMEAREKYREFYMKAKEEREALEKAFNITSTWS